MGPQFTRRPPAAAATPAAAVPAPAPPAPRASGYADQAVLLERLRATPLPQLHRTPVLARWLDYAKINPFDEEDPNRGPELEAFAGVQAVLRDEETVRALLHGLAHKAWSQRKRMTDVIAEREQEIGLANAGAVMFGNVPVAAFAKTIAAGEVFDDIGAGDKHGRLSHRAQWYVVSLCMGREPLLKAYKASVDPYWFRPNPNPPPATLSAWDHIVDVPWADRTGAGAMNPETVRTILKEVGLPEKESWEWGAKPPGSQPPKKKLPKRLREAPDKFLATQADPSRFKSDAADAWMAARELDVLDVEYDGYVWSGWRMQLGMVTPTIVRPRAAATKRKAI